MSEFQKEIERAKKQSNVYTITELSTLNSYNVGSKSLLSLMQEMLEKSNEHEISIYDSSDESLAGSSKSYQIHSNGQKELFFYIVFSN